MKADSYPFGAKDTSEVRQDYSVAVLPYGDRADWLGLKDLRQVCDGHATARDRML